MEVQQADLTGVDNDTRRIDQVRLGAVSGMDSGTRGTYFFDAFEFASLDLHWPVASFVWRITMLILASRS